MLPYTLWGGDIQDSLKLAFVKMKHLEKEQMSPEGATVQHHADKVAWKSDEPVGVEQWP